MTLNDEILQSAAKSGPGRGHFPLIIVFSVMVLLGIGAFLSGIWGAESRRAWQAYLVNFLFWTGLCSGTLLFAAVLSLTNARWGRPVKRLAEAPGVFLPVAFLLFWVLYFGKEKIFPWIHEPMPHQKWWLNIEFLFARDGFGLLVLAAIAIAYIYYSVRRDIAMHEGDLANSNRYESSRKALSALSPAFTLAFSVILSLLSIDLIMSLAPDWISTLFPAYYFMGSFYTGLATTMVLSIIAVKTMGMGNFIQKRQFHDLGKLMFGFCVVCGDFFYVQFLVIWYGNLPEETRFILLRMRAHPWWYLAWTVLIVPYAIPFLVLLRRRIKWQFIPMMILSSFILIGMWLERLLLVAPSMWKEGTIPIGIMEVLITAGFFGIVALCILLFLQKVPVFPVADPLFQEYVAEAAEAQHQG